MSSSMDLCTIQRGALWVGEKIWDLRLHCDEVYWGKWFPFSCTASHASGECRYHRSVAINAKKATNQLKKCCCRLPFIVSDKKSFTEDCLLNSCQNRLVLQGTFGKLQDPVSEVIKIQYAFKTMKPALIMALRVVRGDGRKCPSLFIPKGERLNSRGCIKLLEVLKDWANTRYGKGGYTFTQDGAKPHTAEANLK